MVYQIPLNSPSVSARLTDEQKAELNAAFSALDLPGEQPIFRDALLELARSKQAVNEIAAAVISPDTLEFIRVNSGEENVDKGIHAIYSKSLAREDLISEQSQEIERLQTEIAALKAVKPQEEVVDEPLETEGETIEITLNSDEKELIGIIAQNRFNKFKDHGFPLKSVADTVHDLAFAQSTIHNYGGGYFTGV